MFSAAEGHRPGHTVTPDTQIPLEHSSSKGLDYILSLLQDGSKIWPRTISTKATAGKQIIVNNRYETLAYFKAAKYFDCRISSYPYWRLSALSDYLGVKNVISPNFIMIDLDLSNFGYADLVLRSALQKALKRIKDLLDMRPAVIWSGNGYHIYIPINAAILEDIKEFANIENVSTKFLRFAEWYLSSGESDSAHNNTVSLNNCMLRIPGSYNSKNNAQVGIIKKWDGNRPPMKLLIGSFCAYLTDQRIKEQRFRRLEVSQTLTRSNSNKDIYWIENLLQMPLQDHRKFVVWMILPQYLINVKKLSYEQTNKIINNWLHECDRVTKLDSTGIKQKLREGFRSTEKGFLPIGFEKLKNWKPELYRLIGL